MKQPEDWTDQEILEAWREGRLQVLPPANSVWERGDREEAYEDAARAFGSALGDRANKP